jgi:hypothetical protein
MKLAAVIEWLSMHSKEHLFSFRRHLGYFDIGGTCHSSVLKFIRNNCCDRSCASTYLHDRQRSLEDDGGRPGRDQEWVRRRRHPAECSLQSSHLCRILSIVIHIIISIISIINIILAPIQFVNRIEACGVESLFIRQHHTAPGPASSETMAHLGLCIPGYR